MIIEHLDLELKGCFLKANEIYVASGLISNDGAENLVNLLNKNTCADWEDVHIIVGIDMPTPAKSLKILKKLAGENADVLYYGKKGCYFHPKVYLFKMKNKYVAYVGSANLTTAGLGKNIELSSKITKQMECKDVLKWFRKIAKDGEILTDKMISRYERRRSQKATNPESMDEFKHKEKSYIAKDLVTSLKTLRLSKKYSSFCNNRKNEINELRKIIDLDNDFKNFKAAEFCNQGALGHIIAFNIEGLEKAVKKGKMAKLCKMLQNEKIPVTERIEKALNNPRYKVNKAGINVVSKILATMHPEKYFLWNNRSMRVSKALGFTLPRGLTQGQKYYEYCKEYGKMLKKLKIQDFAVLDRMLYELSL